MLALLPLAIEEYKRFFEQIKGNEYEYAYQAQHVAFSKMLGFEDDEHLEEWISENPQWCDDVKGSEVFNECETISNLKALSSSKMY
jgi:hypothetical protein